ncbi:hypothetical protein GUJ93_ZPchr0006g42913 [Zizania palustris]|uniref:Uncharacterized protein n=1 Tax=Zizania palustris TaxID=103762 RepID=A0A8J5VMI9_ZIZPA|nr:hypothetical protein GUJ93_ZPchr0006g42913 [Zizania palustris]
MGEAIETRETDGGRHLRHIGAGSGHGSCLIADWCRGAVDGGSGSLSGRGTHRCVQHGSEVGPEKPAGAGTSIASVPATTTAPAWSPIGPAAPSMGASTEWEQTWRVDLAWQQGRGFGGHRRWLESCLSKRPIGAAMVMGIIADVVPWIAGQDVQVLMPGTGRPNLEEMPRRFEPEHNKVQMAHRITAGADVLLPPSQFEPC